MKPTTLYKTAIVICVIDIALAAVAIHVRPDFWFAPAAMGLCIWVGALFSHRLMKARKSGVRA